MQKLGRIAPRDGGRVILQGCLKIESEIIIGAAASLAPIVSQPINPSLRANGSRECAPDDRLSEAIPLAAKKLDCFVAFAPRNDDLLGRLGRHMRPIPHGRMWGGEARAAGAEQFFAERALSVGLLVTPAPG